MVQRCTQRVHVRARLAFALVLFRSRIANGGDGGTVLLNMDFYPRSDSCFIATSFTLGMRPPKPELVAPQAVAGELSANCFRLIAAFSSRSCRAPQLAHVHSRSSSVSSA